MDASSVTVEQTLALATKNGAVSQGRKRAGYLEAGAAADLVMLNTEGPWMQPAHDQRNNVIFSAQGSDVCLTMVDGEVLYAYGSWKTIDVERAVAQTALAARDIIQAL